MKKSELRFYQLKLIFLIGLFKLTACFRKGKYWVVLERGYEVRDNAYFFYKFLKEHHPEKKVYYLIEKKSVDYSKVREDAVNYGSLKSYWVMARAEKIISTHYCVGLPGLNKRIFNYFKMNKKYYFLQHGISMNFHPVLQYEISGLKMHFCGAKAEYDYVRDVYGLSESVAKYTGLARYDNLYDVTATNTILFMPTWRKYIKNRDEFEKSDYLKNWQAVLNDQKLIRILEENDLKLVFYPHYESQKYIDMFESKSENIVLAHFADYDVQTLLKEAKLLVTDYSSVFMDVAYMGKPVVYFQFDKEEFYAMHYHKGYFSFEEMGFGAVLETSNAVVEQIEYYIRNSFEMESIYKERTDKFFVLKDKHNCERIYDEITKN